MAAITAFGTWLGRRGRSVKDYFLGGRSVPWWALAACIVATETSTLTFIGAPGTAYNGNWTFLQLVIGYVIGRILIAAVFLPAYFRGEIYTSYELLQRRFGGGAVRSTAAAIFLMYRTLGDGIRLHAAALVLAVASGGPRWEWVCILVLGAAMIVYTEEGGVTATIWTDTIQMFVYLLGALICLVAVIQVLPEGVSGALAAASAAGKTQPLRFLLRPAPAVHVLGRRHRRHVPDHRHPRHRPLPRAAAPGRAQPQRRLHRPRALRFPRCWSSSRCSCSWARSSGPITRAGPSRAATRCCPRSCPRTCPAPWSA